jgi:uncharacterized protein (DUF427 family)
MWKYRGQQRPPFAEVPAAGEESVWDYPRPPRIERLSRRVLVRSGDRVLADSQQAWRVLETASPPTVYVPREDVDETVLERSPGGSFCEWKGRAVYWALLAGGRSSLGVSEVRVSTQTVTSSAAVSLLPIGWSYPEPSSAFSEIAAAFSFYPGRVECLLDSERVRAQPGGFYGGWVTDEIRGPFKGIPGTEQW